MSIIEGGPLFGVVIDSLVEHNPDCAVPIAHRLVPGRGEVNDRQPTEYVSLSSGTPWITASAIGYRSLWLRIEFT